MIAKKQLFGAIASALSLVASAQIADAQTIRIKIRLYNDTNHEVTISKLEWNGAYSPRIEDPIPANSYKDGELRVDDHDVGMQYQVSFDASYTDDNGKVKGCSFWNNHDRVTGEVKNLIASGTIGDPSAKCSAENPSTYSIVYRIAEPQ